MIEGSNLSSATLSPQKEGPAKSKLFQNKQQNHPKGQPSIRCVFVLRRLARRPRTHIDTHTHTLRLEAPRKAPYEKEWIRSFRQLAAAQ